MRIASRIPLERILFLDRAMRDGSYPNTVTVARRFEVSRRTVLRDVEFLRDRLHAPIVFNAAKNGFTYSDLNYKLPTLTLTEGELLAVALAERVLEQYVDAPFAPDLKRAFQKIVAGLSDKVALDLDACSRALTFRHPATVPTDGGVLKLLMEAVRDHCRIRIGYWTASRDEENDRIVDPYHVFNDNGQFYLVGYCHYRDALRTFATSRIRALEVTDAQFDAPADFDLESFLKHSFGVIRNEGEALHDVVLRFRADAVRYLTERRWHRSQTSDIEPDGGLILRFKLGDLREVGRFVLSWGGDCEVLEPLALRRRVADESSRTAKLYEST